MSEEVKIKQYGLTVEFSGLNQHPGVSEVFAKNIEQQIHDGVADAAAKFEEDFFLPGVTIGKKFNMNQEQRNIMGLQKKAMNVRVRTAAESIETPGENVSLYKDGDWSIARNRYLGLYILYKGQSMMFVASRDRKDMPDMPEHIRTKWKFLCQMDK